MAGDDTTVRLGEFTMADFAEVSGLWRSAGLSLRPSDEPPETLLKLQRDPALFLVARGADGCIVGTVMGGWDGRRAYVYHLAVLPGRRRRGIATMLMDELESRFRALGALKVKLQILGGNEASRALFRARGYAVEEDCEPWGKELTDGGTRSP
jgi:ribosomal protein S18 acetylase RimI-like enzyme